MILEEDIWARVFLSSRVIYEIVASSNSDWMSCANTRRSVSGVWIQLGEAMISWKFKKHSFVARSSAEAKCKSMVGCSCEIVWLIALLKDFGIIQAGAKMMNCDNQYAISLPKNAVYHEKTKHEEIYCHFI